MAGADRHRQEVTTLTFKDDGFRAHFAVLIFANRPRAGLRGLPKDRLSPDPVRGSWATFRPTVIRQAHPTAKPATGLLLTRPFYLYNRTNDEAAKSDDARLEHAGCNPRDS